MSSVSTTNISGTDNDFDRPSGTGSLCISTQALRTWLLSCCPSGTKPFSRIKKMRDFFPFDCGLTSFVKLLEHPLMCRPYSGLFFMEVAVEMLVCDEG